jgi:hypothetical protein
MAVQREIIAKVVAQAIDDLPEWSERKVFKQVAALYSVKEQHVVNAYHHLLRTQYKGLSVRAINSLRRAHIEPDSREAITASIQPGGALHLKHRYHHRGPGWYGWKTFLELQQFCCPDNDSDVTDVAKEVASVAKAVATLVGSIESEPAMKAFRLGSASR